MSTQMRITTKMKMTTDSCQVSNTVKSIPTILLPKLCILCSLIIFTATCTHPDAANVPINHEAGMSPSLQQVSNPPRLDGDVTLRATVGEDAGRRPTVTGETSLPDGTQGMVTIQSKTTNERAQDRFTIQGGRFKAGPFSSGGEGLEPGSYTLDVTIAIAQVQPPQVKAVIGQNGENLRGPLVKRGSLGPSVELVQDFRLDEKGKVTAGADEAAVSKSVESSLKEARDILQSLQRLERQGREMEAFRGEDTDQLRRCGDLMRDHQSEAKALQERAQALPRERCALLLAAAAGELNLCVSCMTRATAQCDIARGSLTEAEKELRAR